MSVRIARRIDPEAGRKSDNQLSCRYSGSARRGRLLRAAITSVVTVLVLLLVWRLVGGHNLRWQGIDPSIGSIALAALGAACFLVGRAWRFAALLQKREGSARELLGATAASWGADCCSPGRRQTSRSSPWRAHDSPSASPADQAARSSPGSWMWSAFQLGRGGGVLLHRDGRATCGRPRRGGCFVVGLGVLRVADHPGAADARRAPRGAHPEELAPLASRAEAGSSTSSTVALGGRTSSAARSSAGSPPLCSTQP